MTSRIYLDHNATTPLDDEVRDTMLRWLGPPGNPSSAHVWGREAAEAVEEAREAVASLCDWPVGGVVFTSGATEANGIVLASGRWAVSAVEHPSVRAWGEEELPVDAQGRVLPFDVSDTIDGIAVMYANNETGVLQPIDTVARCAGGRWVHIDAAQAPGRVSLRLPVDRTRLSISLSAHKLGGPPGVGALLVAPRRKLAPLHRGGAQEGGRRAGTVPTALIAGFGAAARRLTSLGPFNPGPRDRLEAGLCALGGRIVGSGAARLPNTVAASFGTVNAADLVMHLDLRGVAVSAGAACASGSPLPSPVLAAMGWSGSVVRFSLGREHDHAVVDEALARVQACLGQLEQLQDDPI